MLPVRVPSRWILTSLAVAVVAGVTHIASPAFAADLEDGPPPSERYGTAYSDPRYADIYGRAPPPPYAHPGYGAGPAPVPREPIYRDRPRDDAYAPPYGYAPPHGYAPPPYGPPEAYDPQRRFSGRSPGCLSKDVIQRELVADGWRDFHAPEVLNQHEAHIRARRPDGRLFQLRVDRCSGEVVAVRPLYERGYGRDTYGGYQGPRAY